MSPIYDPPPRRGRSTLYAALACGLVAVIAVLLAVWRWGGHTSESPSVAGAVVAGDSAAGASGAPAGSAGSDAPLVDARADQPPVLGETPGTADSGTIPTSGRASPAQNAAASAGSASRPGKGTAVDPRSAASSSPGLAGPRAGASSAPRDGAAAGNVRAAAPTSPLTPSGSPTAPTPAHPSAPPSNTVTNVRPETTPTATPDSGSEDTTHRADSGTPGGDVPADQADRDTDREPPIIDSLAFDPPQIDDGNPVRLLIHAHDNLAGVRSVTGNIRSPSARAIFSFEAAAADPGGNLYIANMNIPAKAETGAWYVAYVYIPDRADNALIASFTPTTVPPGGTLNVTSHESDSTPPVIQNIVIANATVQGGEHNRMHVDIEDDSSGVASIVGSFKSPSGSALIPFIIRLSPQTQTWEGDIIVPQSADCGQWTINQIIATDKAGNAALLQAPNPAVERVGFQVVGSTCDDSPPELDAFSMNPTTVSNESTSEIIVTATVSDSGSGTASVTGWATGPPATNGVTPKILFACVATTPADPGSPWTGKILVPQYAAKGTWRITRVRLQDRAQNYRDYSQSDAIIATSTFTVD